MPVQKAVLEKVLQYKITHDTPFNLRYKNSSSLDRESQSPQAQAVCGLQQE